jgi:transcriptional regulator with XRE-family HTH domain
MKIGEIIKKIAQSKNISAQELGKRVSRTRQAIYDIYSDRVSINVKLLKEIALALDEPITNFFIEGPESYYDMMPKVVPMEQVLKLIANIHEMTKTGSGLVNLRIIKSRESIFIFESSFRELKYTITEEEINKFGNYVYESYLVTSPELLEK